MSEIDNKIRADLFRKRIEDKNTLTGAGAIYVGTGIPKYISSTGAITGAPLTGTIGPFYETVGVAPTTGGQVPVSVMGTGSAEATGTVAGLAFKSVNDAMKDADGNITLNAKGFDLTANGTMNIESNVCNLTATGSSGSFVNIQANRINLKTSNVTFGDDLNKTTLNNVGEISFPDAPAAPPYVAPAGTLKQPGGEPYPVDTGIYSLTPIISNISARLDRLGFKEGSYETTISYGSYGTSTAKIKISKCGRYILLKFIDDFYYFPKLGHQYLITDLPDWAIPIQVEVDPDSGDGMTIGEFSVGAGSNITKATKPAIYLDLYSRIDNDKCALTINVKSHSGSATQPKWEGGDCVCLFAGFTFGYNLDEPELEEGSN